MHETPTSRDVIANCVSALLGLIDDRALNDDLDAIAAAIRIEPPLSDGLDRLTTWYGLTAFERDVLTLIGLTEEHESIAHLARHVSPVGQASASAGLISAALRLDWGGRGLLRDALETGPLHQAGLVTSGTHVPLPERELRLPPGLWAAIRGTRGWPSGLEPVELGHHDDEVAVPILEAIASCSSSVVVATGSADRGPLEIAELVATALSDVGMPCVGIPSASLDHERSRTWSAHCVARAVAPIVVGNESTDLLTTYPGRVIVCLPANGRLARDPRPMRRVDVGAQDLAEARRLWRSLVPELGDSQADEIAGLLRVGHIDARRAVADARSTTHSELDRESIVDAVKKRSIAGLPESARLVKPSAEMETLVLPPREAGQIQEVLDRLQQQLTVLEDWGFGTVRGTRGVRVLLSGPPGTGKTFTAEALAHKLGLDLMIVDLSALVSKWIGETEKNIAEVFDAAERHQAVLFFDEADAIFGRRTEVDSANARWANLETSYLLTRIEAFEGLIALATNLRSNIDDAFFRRLDVIVHLTEPGYHERVRLWKQHMADKASYCGDVDIEQLASLYPITGGQIRNASLAAAFAAAARGTSINQAALLDAIRAEYDKSGRSFPGVPIRGSIKPAPAYTRFPDRLTAVATIRPAEEAL